MPRHVVLQLKDVCATALEQQPWSTDFFEERIRDGPSTLVQEVELAKHQRQQLLGRLSGKLFDKRESIGQWDWRRRRLRQGMVAFLARLQEV